MSEVKYYAEFDTDKYIREKFFHDFSYKGLIVEVGGATPEFLSMSKHFKDNGWRSIIVEPNPDFVEEHKKAGNEIYSYACSYENQKEVEFSIIKQNVPAYGGIVTDHSFSSISVKPEYLLKTGFTINPKDCKKIIVEVKRLEDILFEIGVDHVDILSIDTEGWEIEVMRGIDTNKINVDIIIIENLLHDESYVSYMLNIGYKLHQKIHYNYIFVK